MPCLIQKTVEGELVKQWELHDTPLTVGRGDKVAAKIDDKQMSRLHFTIAPKGGGYLLEDCKSSNGTWVNGKHVEGATPLKANDRIRAGETHFVFEDGLGTVIGQLEKEGRHYSSFVRDLSEKKKP
jgi:pSer/pThr/pTyr-binding forkhead associated (FHA) protein